jgi:hypothetical protein
VSERAIPDFARLLAPFIGSVPEAALPGFLARLERGAADRYRSWASAAGEAAPGLLACAAREDEIADRVERLLPADPAETPKIEAALPGARDTYLAVFEDLPLREQLRIQAGAERQGASAWRGLASQHPDAAVRKELELCAELEEESASYLEQLLRDPASPLGPSDPVGAFLDEWHRIVSQKDVAALETVLAEDISLGAPPYWGKLQGRQVVTHLLALIVHTIEGFTYHREWTEGNELALEFTGRVGDLDLQGIDLITLNEQSVIQNLDVLMRPVNAVVALREVIAPQMAKFLAELQSRA